MLANDIESLSRQAYAHIPPSVHNELARDQFIQALSPTELHIQTQLAHPESLQVALGQSSPEPEKPACVAEMTELIRAVSLRAAQNTCRGPRVCLGSDQPGHLRRDCPMSTGAPGNGSGSA